MYDILMETSMDCESAKMSNRDQDIASASYGKSSSNDDDHSHSETESSSSDSEIESENFGGKNNDEDEHYRHGHQLTVSSLALVAGCSGATTRTGLRLDHPRQLEVRDK